MFYDANGRPDPNGDFEKSTTGSLILRDGGRVRSSMLTLRDAAAPGVFFTDAERQLFDSAEGKSIIAQARASHQRRHAYLGDRAPKFTDTQAATTIRNAAAQKAGAELVANSSATATAQAKASFDAAQVAATAARRLHYAR